jgi:hypothetical protein
VFISDKLCGVEVTDTDNPTSLLKYSNNYNNKIFFGRDSGVDVKQFFIPGGVAK